MQILLHTHTKKTYEFFQNDFKVMAKLFAQTKREITEKVILVMASLKDTVVSEGCIFCYKVKRLKKHALFYKHFLCYNKNLKYIILKV